MRDCIREYEECPIRKIVADRIDNYCINGGTLAGEECPYLTILKENENFSEKVERLEEQMKIATCTSLIKDNLLLKEF